MKFFENYIGQTRVIRHLSSVLNALAEKRRVPFQHITLIGEAGCGKSYLMSLLLRMLNKAIGEPEEEEKKFRLFEFNGSTVTLPQIITALINSEGRPRLFLFDEAANMSHKVRNFIKGCMETNGQVKVVKEGDFELTMNPFQDWWFFASNEDLKDKALFGPTGRTITLPLEHYTPEQAKKIMLQRIETLYKDDVKLDDDAADFLIGYVFPNGRAIKTIVDNDLLLVGGHITVEKAKKMVKENERYPKGLSKSDIELLRFLASNEKGWQVQECAAHLGQDSKMVSYSITGLSGVKMAFTHAGRKLATPFGKAYLTALDEAKKRSRSRQAAQPVAA